jgi:hypothetical protein
MKRRPRAENGIKEWLRFGEWCRGQRYLLVLTPMEAVATIQRRFDVSRATAYRWLAAWREVSVEFQQGVTP